MKTVKNLIGTHFGNHYIITLQSLVQTYTAFRLLIIILQELSNNNRTVSGKPL